MKHRVEVTVGSVTFKRSSERTYTHAVFSKAGPANTMGARQECTFHQSLELAQKEAQARTSSVSKRNGQHYCTDVVVLPVEVVA